ncbi:MAG: hypothetical protein DRG78_15690 [Epsilonproteobacteria bacterium]|nr:MAG: hypothetical protein DRG78_15690 [Campylobacterota bacterium]
MKQFQEPSNYTVFKHVLTHIGKKNVPIKKDSRNGNITYKTAISFRDTIQKVYFDTRRGIIKFTSLHNWKEETDYEIKPEWLGEGKVTFKRVSL